MTHSTTGLTQIEPGEPDETGSIAEPPRFDSGLVGLAALLRRGRKQRDWCCESCRVAAEHGPSTW
jgi:hypothetical protein